MSILRGLQCRRVGDAHSGHEHLLRLALAWWSGVSGREPCGNIEGATTGFQYNSQEKVFERGQKFTELFGIGLPASMGSGVAGVDHALEHKRFGLADEALFEEFFNLVFQRVTRVNFEHFGCTIKCSS
ncbi:hypothetical protein BLA6863_03983 [Burkholderia lata]|uniref:Uncharacterized protein n=1 Tax=Burkholderia lata (strain ATCC 17760 / DSM 23089 / LMG 22485 / NCIMB 9086 / R18194 / 383) TaxID=482957 RepID=A0A6P2MEM3_BURL3|nr:hypothetical protein BLA6863_03983 [Burkholderia lata]